jgi:hypothetical protein
VAPPGTVAAVDSDGRYAEPLVGNVTVEEGRGDVKVRSVVKRRIAGRRCVSRNAQAR